jgi:tetratricopeptide (TPR) repeat protein
MLLADERYRPKSGELLQMVSTGVPSATAFTQVYARTLDAVAVDLRNYVRQSRYTYFRVSYTAPVSWGDVAARRVDTFEADLVTANLLAAMIGREADARAALERLAGQKPNDPGVLETLAYFELRRGRREAALQYLSRAVDANSRMASLYRDYASLEPSRAEELLPKAIALDPHDIESRLAYANLLLTARRAKDAETILTAVTDPPPEYAYRYYRLLAGTYVEIDRLDDARTAAARAEKYARPGAEAQSIAALVKTLEEYALLRTLGTIQAPPK